MLNCFASTGTREESRQDGRLLFDNFQKQQGNIWRQKESFTRHHRKSQQISHLRRYQNIFLVNTRYIFFHSGLSTLTNISRYDLPDPDTYKDFFNVHPLYDFQSLQSTCTFFKGCPLNKLDLAIAYELPEILTAHKRRVTQASFDTDAKINVPQGKPTKKK